MRQKESQILFTLIELKHTSFNNPNSRTKNLFVFNKWFALKPRFLNN